MFFWNNRKIKTLDYIHRELNNNKKRKEKKNKEMLSQALPNEIIVPGTYMPPRVK